MCPPTKDLEQKATADGSVSISKLIVTAPRGVVVSREGQDGVLWWPSGTRHARKNEDLLTLCGLFAVEWKAFWEMRFDPDAASSCADCARIVRGT